MNYPDAFYQIAFYLVMVGVSFSIGLAFILLSKSDKENWIPRSFIYGAGILMIASYWISYFNTNGFRKAAIPAMLLLLAATVAIYAVRRKVLLNYIKGISKGDFVNTAICCILSALPLLLIIVFGAQFPYCDGYTYICNADYLMEHGYRVMVNPEDIVMHPWLSQTFLYQTVHLRIGAQMFMAFFSSIFGVWFSLGLFLPVAAFGIFLCGMGSWSFIRKKYAVNGIAKFLAVILVVGNVPIIIWNALYGYLPQTFGTAFFTAAAAEVFDFSDWRKDRNWNVFAAAVLFACEGLAYSEMLPFLCAVTAIYMVRYICLHKEEWKQSISYMSACAITAMSVIITYVPGMAHAVLSQFGAVVGGHRAVDINTYMAYFLSSVPAEYSFMTAEYGIKLYFFEVLTLIGGGGILIGFCKNSRENRKEFMLVSLPYLCMFIYFILFTENPFTQGKVNSWSVFKLMQYYFALAAPYMAIFIADAIGNVRKFLVGIAVAVFIAFNIHNALYYEQILAGSMKNYVGRTENPIEAYYALYEKYGNKRQVITLYDVPIKHRQMVTYFLKDVPLVSNWDSDDYFGTIPIVPKELYGTGINLIYDLSDGENVAGLVERDIGIVFSDGFYATETYEEKYWNWSRKESILNIARYKCDGEYLLRCDIWGNGRQEQILNIYSNTGELLQTLALRPNEVAAIAITVDEQVDALRFQCDGEAIMNENDPRELVFAVSNYSIEEINGIR